MAEEGSPWLSILISWIPMLLIIWAWWYFITRVTGAVRDVASALREVAGALGQRHHPHS